MKVAIVGSRSLSVSIDRYVPKETTLIISGGAVGIDTVAENYADTHDIPKLIIRPEYAKYGRYAPLIRNKEIVGNADLVIAFWDGKSRGTLNAISQAKTLGKRVIVHNICVSD